MHDRPIFVWIRESRLPSSRMARSRRARPPQIVWPLATPGVPLEFTPHHTGSGRTRCELSMSYGVRHWAIAARGLPTISRVICLTRRPCAPIPPLLETGPRIPASAGPAERHHWSSASMRRKRPPANVTSGLSRRKLQIDGELRPSAQPREIFGEPISREAEGAEADMVKRARHRDVCAMHTLMAIDRAPGRSKTGLPKTSPPQADPLK